jgi:uncharacterized spore protein YtfJ
MAKHGGAKVNEEMELPQEEMGAMRSALFALNDLVGEFLDTVGVTRVYGEPVEKGDHTVIPAAEIVAVLGFGMGGGTGAAAKTGEQGTGYGSGGGGKTFSRPVAVVIASPSGVRVEPVVDATKVALAFFTALGFMLATALGMMNARRMRHHLLGKG